MKKIIVFLILFLSLFVSRTGAILITNDNNSNIIYFVFRDQTAGTVDTGVTVTNIDCYYIEDGAAISAKFDVVAHGAANDAFDDEEGFHCGYGVYRIDFPDIAFDGGVGKRVQLIAIDGDGGAFTEIMEVELSAPVNTVAVGGTTQTANDMSGDIDDVLTDTEAQDSTTEIRTLLTGADTPVAKETTSSTIAGYTDDIGVAGVGLTAVVWNSDWDAEVESEVDDSIGGGTGTSLTAIVWNSDWDAQVQSEVDDGLKALALDHLIITACDTGPAIVDHVVDNSILAFMIDDAGDISAYDDAKHSLVAIGDDADLILADTGTDGVILKAAGLDTDAVTEIWAKALTDIGAGAPSATCSVFTAINRIYMVWRNKTITNGTNDEIEYYNDANTKIMEAPISDDGTDFTRSEVGAVD